MDFAWSLELAISSRSQQNQMNPTTKDALQKTEKLHCKAAKGCNTKNRKGELQKT